MILITTSYAKTKIFDDSYNKRIFLSIKSALKAFSWRRKYVQKQTENNILSLPATFIAVCIYGYLGLILLLSIHI